MALEHKCQISKIIQVCPIADFTDNANTTGSLILADDIPAGATVIRAAVTAIVGFAGDTTAVMDIGDGSDEDRYNAAAINVFATAAGGIDAGDPGGLLYHPIAASPELTITGAADFTSIVTDGNGSVTIEITYIS